MCTGAFLGAWEEGGHWGSGIHRPALSKHSRDVRGGRWRCRTRGDTESDAPSAGGSPSPPSPLRGPCLLEYPPVGHVHLSSPSVFLSRLGNRTRAVRSCDGSPRRPPCPAGLAVSIRTAVPGEAELPWRDPRGDTFSLGSSWQELRGRGRAWGLGTFKFTCPVIFEKLV